MDEKKAFLPALRNIKGFYSLLLRNIFYGDTSSLPLHRYRKFSQDFQQIIEDHF